MNDKDVFVLVKKDMIFDLGRKIVLLIEERVKL